MDRIGCLSLAHLHVLVDDIDDASRFYREVLDFVEMQSHNKITNRGLATYYGFGDDPENFVVSLRFMAWPGVLTLKLIKAERGYSATRSTALQSLGYNALGLGPISVRVVDIDSTYDYLLKYAQDYDSRYKIQLVSPPVFLSPLLPHQIGATKNSALHGHEKVLQQIAATWPKRAKFQLIDPFGIRWEFNNNVI